MEIISPDSCPNCGWVPAIKNNEDQEIADDKKWIVIPIPSSVAWLFVCPSCKSVTGNKNVIENVIEIKKMKEQRIIQPKPGSILGLPGINKN